MGERSFDDMFDQINKLSPKLKQPSTFVLPSENILDLNLISSASDRNDEKKEETGRTSESEVFLTDDQIFSSKFKEIKLDAKPLDFSETTPRSTYLGSQTSTPASNSSHSAEVNYANFESAAFKEHITRDSLDSVAYLNLELDGPRTQTGKTPPPLAKAQEESAEVKNEFGKFYDNMYYTSLHGPPVVGAFILRNKDSRNEFMFKYPQSLDPKIPGNDETLKATYSSESYTTERNHTAELQSALHLLPGLAFGSQKKDSLVDFVHFVLPTSSGNVLYGTSYVLQFTEKVETYGSLLNMINENLRKQPGKKPSTDYFDPRAPPPVSARGPLNTLKETGAKALDFFDSASTKPAPAPKPESKENPLGKDVDLLDLSSPKKKGEAEPITKSSALKELDFLNFDPAPAKTASGATTKKSEFKPFDFFNFETTPAKSEQTSSKEAPTKADSGSCDTGPQDTKAKVFSLLDFEDKDKKEADEEEKNKQENKLFGMFSDLNIKKSLFGDDEEDGKKKEDGKENKVEKNEKEKDKQGEDKSDLKESKSLVKPTEEEKKPEKESLLDLGYKTGKELGFDLAKKLGWEPKSEEKGLESTRGETRELPKGILKESSKEYGKDAEKNPVKDSSGGAQKDTPKMSSLEAILDFGNKLINESKGSGYGDSPSSSSQDSEDQKAFKLGLKTKQDMNSKLGPGRKVSQEKEVGMGRGAGLEKFGQKLELEVSRKLSMESRGVIRGENKEIFGQGLGGERDSKFEIGRRLSFDVPNRTDRENRLGLGARMDKGLNLEKDHKLGLERRLSGEKALLEQKGLLKEKKVGEGVEVKGEGSGSVPQVKKPEPEPELYTRYYVAICLVYTVPFFGVLGSRLEYVAQTYFDNKNFNDDSLLLSFVEHINKTDKPEEWSYESLFFNLEYHFKPFSLCLSYRALLFLLKSVLAEQRIAIYSECAARTSTCILSILTMIPCANSLNFNSKAFGSLWYSWKKYGFPLDLFRHDNPIYPYFTEAMVPLLRSTSGYLIGITDLRMLTKFAEPPTLIFDLEDEAIKLRTRDLLGFYSPSFYEITYFNDFEIFEDVEIDDEPLKMVLDTSENIFHFVGDYLSKAPSTIIHLGGKASKIYHIGRSLGSRRHKESYLRLFDVYFPGALPKFLRFSKKLPKAKKSDQSQSKGQRAEIDGEGEDDMVGKQERVTKYQKKKKADTLDELKAQWDKVIQSDTEDKQNDIGMSEELVKGELEQPAFTFKVIFEKMRRRSMKYRYLDYIETLHSEVTNDRTKEIEYSIFTRIQPLRDFLLKFLKSVAYAGGKRRLAYQLVMDFTFDLDSMVDFNNPVDGAYVVRGGKFLRGCMQEEPDSDEEEQDEEEVNKKSYLMEGDEEVVTKVPAMLATFILELHNNYSVDFFELWIQTKNFTEFFKNHSLEVFNEPVFYLSNNLAKYTYPNGDFYVGELSDMLRDGKGSYVSKDGSRYDGTWKRDKRHGKGTLVTSDIKYTGEWINDRRHGFGRLETQGYSYVGDFRLNKYHGNGTMVFKSGVKLKGEFRNGKFEGKGIMNLPDGSIRMGTFKNGVITGVCSVIDKEGRVYVGKLYGDLFHGKGVLKYNKQTSFEGFWIKGKREKQGMIINKVANSTIKIEGVWENDNMLMNEVLITFPNGYKYNGSVRYFPTLDIDLNQFKEDRDFRNMDPKPSDLDVVTFLQEFKRLNNRLLPHGNGICKDTNGGVYNGGFHFGSRHGTTSEVFPNGLIYSGDYYLGKFHGNGKLHLQSNESIPLEYEKGKLLNEEHLKGKEVLKDLLDHEFTVFEKDFTRYKLDFLVEVMRSTSTLQSSPVSDQTVSDLIRIN
ncbi:MORN motif repeat containing protein [Theileria orientalis]|uniref:MORN motif repeat containing protein n=1 Tax=Theileria orientalis TaxID=68886 RepID=A0A976M4W7_THEOR|nr:MORN motif repeat containing protein [Theileria orientalis]